MLHEVPRRVQFRGQKDGSQAGRRVGWSVFHRDTVWGDEKVLGWMVLKAAGQCERTYQHHRLQLKDGQNGKPYATVYFLQK